MFREEYETERLTLMLPSMSLAVQITEFEIRNREFFNNVTSIRDDEYYTLDCQKEIIWKSKEDRNKETNLKYWLILKDSNQLVGFIAFNNIVRGPFQSCFLSYSMDHKMINQGLMTEAVGKGIQILFDDLKLHRIEANIMPGNTASLKVVSKFNFVNEGLSKKYLYINGKWEDHIHMVLLNENYDN